MGHDLVQEVRGEERLANERAFGTPAVVPKSPEWVRDSRSFLRRQSQVFGGEELAAHYLELLARAERLLRFMDANAGPSPDWPMTVYCDTEGTAELLERHFSELRDVVGVLQSV